eukprot:3642837-Pyramimonas_sp.AAC.1
MALEHPQRAPSRFREAPTTASDGVRRARSPPRKTAPNGTKMAQDGPRGSQEVSKTAPGAFKSASRKARRGQHY